LWFFLGDLFGVGGRRVIGICVLAMSWYLFGRDVTHDWSGYVEGERFVLGLGVNVSGIIDASLLGFTGVWMIFVNQAGQSPRVSKDKW